MKTMSENDNQKEASLEKKDLLFDLNGLKTGIPLDKKQIIAFSVTIALFIIGSAMPLHQYGNTAGMALGLVLATIGLWIFNVLPVIVPALIMVVASLLFHFVDLGQVQSTLGNSAVYITMGLVIVSMGAESSNIARRLAYCLGAKFSKKPHLILLAMGIATAIMSAFVSNTATVIMMSGIGAGVLKAMGEQPGKSKFGSVMILFIGVSTSIGGTALINGCPGINGMCISLVENATKITVKYSEWAKLGAICAIAIIIPAWLIYMRCGKFKNSDLKNLDPQYFANLSKELGPLSGSEFRWILTVVIMVICLLYGMALPTAGLLFGTITLLPLVGTVNGKDAMKKMPFDVIIMCGLVPLYGVLFNNTGLSQFFGSVVGSIIPKDCVLLVIMIPALLMALMGNLFVNASAGVAAVCVGAVAPIMVQMGYNPAVCLLPTMMLCGYTIGFGTHIQMMITYGHGYWEMNQVVKPGFILVIVAAIIFSILLAVLGPVIGLNLYL
jgi:sodium-dependent dicarboxylate transporter 2/3/5